MPLWTDVLQKHAYVDSVHGELKIGLAEVIFQVI